MKHQISQLIFKRFQNSRPTLPAYNESADFEWIRTQSGLPWLLLTVDVPYQCIFEEIINIQSLMVPHRDQYAEHKGWHSFCVHGKSHDATREDMNYNDSRPHVWTAEAKEFMPRTVDYFDKSWPHGVFSRLRVMLLEPGGYITVHSDSEKSCLSAINIAITQPNDCYFLMEQQGIVPFKSGRAFWLDLSNRHVVFNNSNQPRWHLIVHQTFDHLEFHKLVVNSYKQLYNNSNEDSYYHNSR
jgi:hypothetical protein